MKHPFKAFNKSKYWTSSMTLAPGNTTQKSPIHGWVLLEAVCVHTRRWRRGEVKIELHNLQLPEANIVPQNRPFQKEMNLPTIDFEGLLALSFWEGNLQVLSGTSVSGMSHPPIFTALTSQSPRPTPRHQHRSSVTVIKSLDCSKSW